MYASLVSHVDSVLNSGSIPPICFIGIPLTSIIVPTDILFPSTLLMHTFSIPFLYGLYITKKSLFFHRRCKKAPILGDSMLLSTTNPRIISLPACVFPMEKRPNSKIETIEYFIHFLLWLEKSIYLISYAFLCERQIHING